MKILGEPPRSTAQTKKTTAKTVDLMKYRKKKRRPAQILKLIAVLLAAAGVLYVWINAERIFEPFRGIASKIETKTSNDVGFPVKLPGSAGYSFERFGDNFTLLTDTYLYAYETNGGQIFAHRHGYSNPAQVTTSRRILLYDKAAYSFSVYNKTSIIYEHSVDDKIVYGTVAENDMTVIVTTSVRYSNIIYVYDSSGNWKYTRKLANENVMQVKFTDNEHIAVSTISVDSGELVCNYYRFSIRSGEGSDWKYSFKNNSLPCDMYADGDKLVSVCDNCVVMLDSGSGELIGMHVFSGTLRGCDISADKTAVFYNDVSSNQNIIALYDEKLHQTASYKVTSAVQRLVLDSGRLYVLDGTRMKIFGGDASEEDHSTALTDDYSDFVKIGNYVYLLGYDFLAEERIE